MAIPDNSDRNVVVVGMQWGDEGKGKVVDLLCPAFDGVVRFQGGNNAGHTVKFGDEHFALHLVPSGILHEGTRCVIGNGVVLDPDAFFHELDGLAASGVGAAGRLFVSSRVHLILPTHVATDKSREAGRGEAKIGTTGRGIGPAYGSKIARSGIRAGDLVAAAKGGSLEALFDRVADSEDSEDAEEAARADLAARLGGWAERLAPMVRDTSLLLNDWIDGGRTLLFEGAQGALLDVDHGTYPYVTSSNSTAGGAATGTGVPPSKLGAILGVLKAYTTRVGEGPFIGELHDETGEFLRSRGNEFGTTTGRPRRCGWLDTVAARYSRRVNGIEAIALTKLDVLDEFEEIPVLTAYRIGGEVRRDFPATVEELEDAEPVFETLPGWKADTVGILEFDKLPAAARDYVAFIEREVSATVCLISTGPRREETIPRGETLGPLLGGRVAATLGMPEAPATP